MSSRKLQLAVALAAAGAAFVAVRAAGSPERPHPEKRLVAALDAMQAGRVTEALDDLDELVRDEPNFRVAQLFYSQLLSARAGAGTQALSDPDQRLSELVEEARLRLQQAHAGPPPPNTVPSAILQLSERNRHALLVDLPKARLYLLENNGHGLVVTRDYYAAMGKNGYGKQVSGDNRTPLGIYRITEWLDGAGLPDLYGAGAFPTTYPNLWDRALGKTGSGIWLHGVPSGTYTRAPRSSEGCVTVANADLMSLRPFVRPGETPVILSDSIEWVPRNQAIAAREAFLQRIEDWRSKWSARDTEGYLSFYAPEFEADGMNRTAFAEHKRRVNAGKRFIEVKLEDLDVYRYPGDANLVLAEFTQDYASDNFRSSTRKQQYWRRDAAGRWNIVREANSD